MIIEGIPDTILTALPAIAAAVIIWKVTHAIVRLVALAVAVLAVGVGILLYTGVLTL